MSSKNDKYRNPPAPLGYVCKEPPKITPVKGINIDGTFLKLLDLITGSGILDAPNVTIYRKFIGSCDTEDGEIVEIPVETPSKVVEVIDVDADIACKSINKGVTPITVKKEPDLEDKPKESSAAVKDFKKDASVTIKKEVDSTSSDDTVSRSSEDLEKGTKDTKFVLNTEANSSKKSKKSHTHRRKHKKHSRDYERRSHKKKIRERTASCDISGSDNDSCIKRNRHKSTNDCKDDVTSHIKRSTQEKSVDYVSSNDAPKIRKKQKDAYDSDNEICIPKIKMKREHSYNSDDSSRMTEASRYSDRKQYNSTPSYSRGYPDDYERTVNIKQETFPAMYGTYPCEICNISMNSYATYESHVNGKRHQKAMLAKNPVPFNVPPDAELTTKYPKLMPNHRRKKVNAPAKIQHLVDANVKIPCPGLENVTEIQGFGETLYFCSLCDSQCSSNSIFPHLNGFKHQLNCLKKFRKELYLQWNYKSKYQIENLVTEELRAVEKRRGRGLIQVEKDFLEDENSDDEASTSSAGNTDRLNTTSQQASAADFRDKFWSIQPDPTKCGYYCPVCHSHTNSEQMWQNHIAGKRHLTNMKKHPGTAPSKCKYVPTPQAKSCLLKLLVDVIEPVVGLNQIREIQKPEIKGVTYNCYLCGACVSNMEIVNHVLSRKHREKYLDSIKWEELETLRNCHVSDLSMDSIIEEMCVKAEKKYGRGKPDVYFTKNSLHM